MTASASSTKPNIIVIVTDDQGYGDLSCYDNPGDIQTPNIDVLAGDGIRMTHGYASAAVCGPTRAGLLSGRYQQRFGVHGNKDILGKGFSEQFTMADALKKCGYTTGMIGKWHLGRFTKDLWPTGRGFDEFYGFLKSMRTYFGKTPRNPIYRNETPVGAKEGYLTDSFNEEAVSFINRHSHQQQPFFMYLPYNAPHYPMEARADYLKEFNTGNQQRDLYLAMMKSVDEGVGMVINTLKKNKIYKNTLIIFISDNGGIINKGANNGVLRGEKGKNYEGGIRVPFLVSWPNFLPSGQTNSTPVISIDIFPTVVGAAGEDPKILYPNLDGKNMLSNLLDPKTPHHEVLFWKNNHSWAVRDQHHKLLYQKSKGEQRVSLELFDLKNDVSESRNLANQFPDKVKELTALYEHWDAKNIRLPNQW
jgi:arylsulfatase A-like enzyme